MNLGIRKCCLRKSGAVDGSTLRVIRPFGLTARPHILPNVRVQVSAGNVPALTREQMSKRKDLGVGCKTVRTELNGLGVPPDELNKYFQMSAQVADVKPPKGSPAGFDLARANDVWLILIGPKSVEGVTDLEALRVVELMLSELWRWRRRGGGTEDEITEPFHVQALDQIQNVQLEEPDQVTSILLDSLPFTQEQKQEVGSAVQNLAIYSIQSFIWGSIVFTIVGLVLFNFARGAGGN